MITKIFSPIIPLLLLSSTFVQGGSAEVQDKKDSNLPTIEKKLEANPLETIQNQLKDIQLSIQSLKSVDSDNRLRKLDAEIAILKDQISRLEMAINKINTTRSAGSYTPPVAANATIKLANSSALIATVILNGKTYKVPPFQTTTLSNQNVGEFNYQVTVDGFGLIQASTNRTVGANETFTISIYPR